MKVDHQVNLSVYQSTSLVYSVFLVYKNIMHIYIGADVVAVETEQGRLFAICNPHLLSGLPVVVECDSAAVYMLPNALARLSIIRSHTKMDGSFQ